MRSVESFSRYNRTNKYACSNKLKQMMPGIIASSVGTKVTWVTLLGMYINCYSIEKCENEYKLSENNM